MPQLPPPSGFTVVTGCGGNPGGCSEFQPECGASARPCAARPNNLFRAAKSSASKPIRVDAQIAMLQALEILKHQTRTGEQYQSERSFRDDKNR